MKLAYVALKKLYLLQEIVICKLISRKICEWENCWQWRPFSNWVRCLNNQVRLIKFIKNIIAKILPFSFLISSSLLILKTFLMCQLDFTKLLPSISIYFSVSNPTSLFRVSLLIYPGYHLSLYLNYYRFYWSFDSTLIILARRNVITLNDVLGVKVLILVGHHGTIIIGRLLKILWICRCRLMNKN